MNKPAFKYLLSLLLVVAASWYVSAFHYQLLLIHGDSMLPAYHSGELVLIERRPAALRTGDAVLFRCDGLGLNLVKRIAAVPGDCLSVSGGELCVNSVPVAPLPEPSLRAEALSFPGTLPSGCYLMLGDNLSESIDSRYAQVGLIPREKILGRLVW